MMARVIERSCSRGMMRALAKACVVGAGVLACAAQLPEAAQGAVPAQRSQTKQFETTVSYVAEFYPLWFSHHQEFSSNGLLGPDRISPVYHIVVAINDDTLYASTFLDLTKQPVVLTVPATQVRYSILTLDPYGDVFDSGIPAGTPGVYALTGPQFGGKLPKGVTPVPIPYNTSVIIFRADKYSASGQNEKKAAANFRASLLMQPLKDWKSNPSGGATKILPESVFAEPFKAEADTLIKTNPLSFLEQLQTAVHAPSTPPLSAAQQKLSDKFDKLFAKGNDDFDFAAGVRAAHVLILGDYLTHTDSTHWVHFTNIGTWKPSQDLDRSAIAEFLQYGNNIQAAAYYHAFTDGSGQPLDGKNADGYVLHMTKDEIPQTERFWSFTAYSPESVELVRNSAHKYEIASYTPGLQFDSDGRITLYFSRTLPNGVPQANWLPIPKGHFNIMLRVYGPEGSVANNKYVPPPIAKRP